MNPSLQVMMVRFPGVFGAGVTQLPPGEGREYFQCAFLILCIPQTSLVVSISR